MNHRVKVLKTTGPNNSLTTDYDGSLLAIQDNNNKSIVNKFSLAPVTKVGIVANTKGYLQEVPLYLIRLVRPEE